MRVLAEPLRIESGAFATVEQGSDRHLQQLAASIVSTRIGERRLAPDVGIIDPAGVGLTSSEVVAALALAEPDVQVTDVTITGPTGGRQSVTVTVAWADDEDEEAR